MHIKDITTIFNRDRAITFNIHAMMNNHLVAWSVCFEIKGSIRMKLKKNCYLLCGAILFYTYSNCAQISNVGAKAYRYLHIYSEDIMSAEEKKIHI